MSEKHANRLKSWAYLRFSIIGPLLAHPPARGELQKELKALAARSYPHPSIEGKWIRFGVSTIERWYYKALESHDPIETLARKVRSDAGKNRATGKEALAILHKQYLDYPHWSYRLHADNLEVVFEENPELGRMPSYATIRRRMKERGWIRKPLKRRRSPGEQRALDHLDEHEVRGFESEYVHALWHLDFHEARRRVVDANGQWHTPKVLCVLDDRSRLCCHIQWYLNETAENLIHGFTQALFKRGLPRSLMTDNGGAMVAAETENGLQRLGIIHEKTLPYSPWQNGKQEAFWSGLEGRLMAMLSRVEPLTLEILNRASQAWVEQEYNRSRHEEMGVAPIERVLKEAHVCRPAPDTETVRLAFSVHETRAQRKSDGTIQIKGIRFEVPVRFRHIPRVHVRYQSWDLSAACLVDERTDQLLCRLHPRDKTKNARGLRRTIETPSHDDPPSVHQDTDPIPALLRKLLKDYAATGLPPAYIPKEEIDPKGKEN